MKSYSLLLWLVLLVSAEKHRHHKHYYYDEDESIESNTRLSRVDLRGTVRSRFILRAALVDQSKNMICSPLSALMPLALLSLGVAKKQRKTHEIYKAVGVSHKKIKRDFPKMIRELDEMQNVSITIANRIFISESLDANTKFSENANDIFKTGLTNVDFQEPKIAASHINNWVYKYTDKKISNLVHPSSISPTSSMVVVNAILFKGFWKHQFQSFGRNTFYTPSGEVKADMMMKKAEYKHTKSEILQAQVIEVPYTDKAYMIILLPYQINGLDKVLDILRDSPELLNKVLTNMVKKEIMLKMPKFNIETELDLKEMYRKIGLRRIFEENSGLTEVVLNDELHISAAVQKAIIEVSERGTVAAAASASMMMGLSYEVKPLVHFEVNHPFFFCIVAAKQILFAGQVLDPSRKDLFSASAPESYNLFKNSIFSLQWGK